MATKITTQVRHHFVALVSLVVAITALGYNSWRNELTESNRNVRAAGFEVLMTIGQLQEIVFFSHYDRDEYRGSPRAGWSKIIFLQDLANLMPDDVGVSMARLTTVWSAEWSDLAESARSEKRISGAIDDLRTTTLRALAALD